MAIDPQDPLAGLPRQLRWKILRWRSGLCTNCSKPRLKSAGARKESTYKRLCWRCGEDRKNKRRAKYQDAQKVKRHRPSSDATGFAG